MGGEKCLLKYICLRIIQEIRSRMLIHPVMKQVHLEWVIHKLHVILFSCRIFFSSESWENHNFHWEKKYFLFIYPESQNHAALFCTQTALKESFLFSLLIFFMVFSSNKWFSKKRHDKCLISLFNHIGIETGNRKESESIKFKRYPTLAITSWMDLLKMQIHYLPAGDALKWEN